MRWARSAAVAVVLLVFAAVGATTAEPKRVLLLRSYGPDLEEEEIFGDYLRTDLANKSPVSLDLYEVSLDAARISEATQDSIFVDDIRALLTGRPPDLVIAMAAPAARFAQRRSSLSATTIFVEVKRSCLWRSFKTSCGRTGNGSMRLRHFAAPPARRGRDKGLQAPTARQDQPLRKRRELPPPIQTPARSS